MSLSVAPWITVMFDSSMAIPASEISPFTFNCSIPLGASGSSSLNFTLGTNDPFRPILSILFTCTVKTPQAITIPPANGGVLEFPPAGPSGSMASIVVNNLDAGGLFILPVAPLAQYSWFSFNASSYPVVVSGLSSYNLTFTCVPRAGFTSPYVETFTFLTSDRLQPLYNYTLSCAYAPAFQSLPSAPGNISLGFITAATYTNITVRNVGFGSMQVTQSGSFYPKSWLSVASGLPIANLSNAPTDVAEIVVRCQPPDARYVGNFHDYLVLSTNDPVQPTVSYRIGCISSPVYSSNPPAGSTLAFDLSTPTVTVTMNNIAYDVLVIAQIQPFEPNSWFSIVDGIPSFPINVQPANFTIRCTVPPNIPPTTTYTELLVLSTWDLSTPNVTYTLSCSATVDGGFLSTPPSNSTVTISNAPAFVTTQTSISITTQALTPLNLVASFPTSNVLAINWNQQTTMVVQPGQSVPLIVSCTPDMNIVGAVYTARVVLYTADLQGIVSQYDIVCISTQSLQVQPGNPQLGTLTGGVAFQRQLAFQNPLSQTITIDLTLQSGDPPPSNSTNTRRGVLGLRDNTFSNPSVVASLSPSSLTLPANSAVMPVTLQIVPLAANQHSIAILLQSSQMPAPSTLVTFQWNALVAALTFQSAMLIDFGTIPVGSSAQSSLVISSTGNAPLQLTSFVDQATSPNTWLSLMTTLPLSVDPLSVVHVTLSCSPTSTGIESTFFTLTTNAVPLPTSSIQVRCLGSASCSDGVQNQGELGVDCGGPCVPCQNGSPTPPPPSTPPPSPPPPPSLPVNATLATPSTSNSSTTTPPSPPGIASPPPVNATSPSTPNVPPPIMTAIDTGTTLSPTPGSPSVQTLAGNSSQPVSLSPGTTTQVVVNTPSGQVVVSVELPAQSMSNTNGSPVELVVGPVDPMVLSSANSNSNVELGSVAIEVTLSDGTSQLTAAATLCFQYFRSKNYDKACLAYIDSNGHWQCQDKCLSKNTTSTLICGTTSHFTSFAVLLSGGQYGCDSYITGTWQGDFALAASVFGFVWCLAFIACILFIFDTPYRRWLRNEVPKRRRRASTQYDSVSDLTINEADYSPA